MSSRRRYQPDYGDLDEGEAEEQAEFDRIESEAYAGEVGENEGNGEQEAANEELEGGEVSLGDGLGDPDQEVSMPFAPEWNSSVRVDRNLPMRTLPGEEEPLDEEHQGYFRARPAPPRTNVEIKYQRPDLASARRKQIEITLSMDPVYMEDRKNEQDKLLVMGYAWISRPRSVRNLAPRKSEMTKILAPDFC